jgi:phosphopantothenoylcysteine decarboxylase/phosphopantothenate--cysteine ligase
MHILITAGGTREYIDPVRFISNASTGKMGYAIARAAIAGGHTVTLVTAPVAIKTPAKANVVHVETSREMFVAVKEHFGGCDCLIMAAAVSDYAPVRTSKTKIKKSDSELTIKLKPTTDILKWAGRNKEDRIVVGFALEDKAIRKRAEEKLKGKKLDMIVANSPLAIAAEKSSVQIKTAEGDWVKLPHATKGATAKRIIRSVEQLATHAE